MGVPAITWPRRRIRCLVSGHDLVGGICGSYRIECCTRCGKQVVAHIATWEPRSGERSARDVG